MDPPSLNFVPVFTALRGAGKTLGVAVSGGSDSMALLAALMIATEANCTISVVTVDHNLRPEAASEARAVAAFCAERQLEHTIVTWDEAPEGNLQNAARRARYRLIAAWASERGIDTVALGHTRDDNEETFVMGLMRGAGLDGLSGMRPTFRCDGVRFIRPLLDTGRGDLRRFLTQQGIDWTDDPSNDDTRYDRVRVRQILAMLPVDPGSIARSIGNLRRSRQALDRDVAVWAKGHVVQEAGDLTFDAIAFDALACEMRRRLLNAALRWVASAEYPPRAEKVMALIAASAGTATTVHGCRIEVGVSWRIGRELQAVATAVSPATGRVLWDGRWQIDGPFEPDDEVRALGKALPQCPDWRATGLPRTTLMAGPAIWRRGALISAPLAGHNPAWNARIVADFQTSLDLH